jgi:hypothetical protein
LDNLIEKLSHIELDNPFPYRDTDKIQDDFHSDFKKMKEDKDSLVGDFNTYCMNIVGARSYVLAGKSEKIPQRQIDLLRWSFFEMFPQYKIFEERINGYKEFYREYRSFDEARTILLMYLSNTPRSLS